NWPKQGPTVSVRAFACPPTVYRVARPPLPARTDAEQTGPERPAEPDEEHEQDRAGSRRPEPEQPGGARGHLEQRRRMRLADGGPRVARRDGGGRLARPSRRGRRSV